MQISSKYNTGNVNVFPIKQQQKPITSPACEVCNGEGFGTVEVEVPKFGNIKINCPAKRRDNNNHRPIIIEVNTDWIVLPPQTIIHLSMSWEDSIDRDYDPFSRNGITYGLTPDKENSRRIWQEADLFSSEEDAQKACDARNKQLTGCMVPCPTHDGRTCIRTDEHTGTREWDAHDCEIENGKGHPFIKRELAI